MAGVDIIRLIAVAEIFLFHSRIHMGVNYEIFNNFVGNGAVFMTLFFMISGFVLYFTYQNSNYSEPINIAKFYYKRLIAIYPAYLVICIIYFIIDTDLSLIKKFMLLPMDLLLMQSTVDGSFSTWHHGGTWFISCLLVCYLMTPFLISAIKHNKIKTNIIIIVILSAIVSYMQIIVHIMNYSGIYSSVIYRSIEFIIGMCLARIYCTVPLKNNKYTHMCFVILLIILIVGIDILSRIGGGYLDYGFFVIPVFALLILIACHLKYNAVLEKIIKSRVVNYMNTIAYEFFLAQLFCFKITIKIINLYPNIGCMKLVICFVFAVILHEIITKPVKRCLAKYSV